jgi:hypothetical protein
MMLLLVHLKLSLLARYFSPTYSLYERKMTFREKDAPARHDKREERWSWR